MRPISLKKSAAKTLPKTFSSSRVSSATIPRRDAATLRTVPWSTSSVGDGSLIVDAGASTNHPLPAESSPEVLARSDLSVTYPSPLLIITPPSVEDKEGPLSDGTNAAASVLSATTFCRSNTAGDNLHLFSSPAAVALDFESPLLPSPVSGGDGLCSITAVEPASLIAIDNLETATTGEDLRLPICIVVAEVLRMCVAQAV